jgi:cytochrome P450
VHDGERLVIGSASANRDERVFADADELRVDRVNADQHLTFGFGPHVCPGATLARAVTRIGMQTLFDRFPPGTITAADDHVYENVPTFFECGPKRLAVETSAGAR